MVSLLPNTSGSMVQARTCVPRPRFTMRRSLNWNSWTGGPSMVPPPCKPPPPNQRSTSNQCSFARIPSEDRTPYWCFASAISQTSRPQLDSTSDTFARRSWTKPRSIVPGSAWSKSTSCSWEPVPPTNGPWVGLLTGSHTPKEDTIVPSETTTPSAEQSAKAIWDVVLKPDSRWQASMERSLLDNGSTKSVLLRAWNVVITTGWADICSIGKDSGFSFVSGL